MHCIPIPIYKWESFKSGIFTIIIARTRCQKNTGLQFVDKLPENTLLLFLNVPSGIYFHTRNCKFPIDIVCLDKYDKVINMWLAFPNTSKIGPMPRGTSKVIEATAGWVKANNIKINDKLLFLNGI